MFKNPPEPVAVILAGGPGRGLSVFAETRAIPAVTFGGKYRIIDFTLSNCVNSGINHLLVLTQFQPISLHRHIGNGKPWDLDRQRGGVRLLSPYLGPKDAGWDRGNADAVYRQLEEIEEIDTDLILILGGDHIYKMDYRPMIEFHRQHKAALTVGAVEVPLEDAHRFGVITTDSNGRITNFVEKPENPTSRTVSMGIYIFDRDALVDILHQEASIATSQRDFGRDIFPRLIADGEACYTYQFDGYWRDIGNVRSYWEASQDLIQQPPLINLYDPEWVIYTRSEEKPPVLATGNTQVENSLLSNGCQVHGTVINSVLSPGVIVEAGAVVRDSVIMNGTIIGKNCQVDRAIIDKYAVIGEGAHIGSGDDLTPNTDLPHLLQTGITVVGKNAQIPANLVVGRNCRIGVGVIPGDFHSLEVASGESVLRGS